MLHAHEISVEKNNPTPLFRFFSFALSLRPVVVALVFFLSFPPHVKTTLMQFKREQARSFGFVVLGIVLFFLANGKNEVEKRSGFFSFVCGGGLLYQNGMGSCVFSLWCVLVWGRVCV